MVDQRHERLPCAMETNPYQRDLNCVARILFIPEQTPRDGEHLGAVASHQHFIRIPITLLKALDPYEPYLAGCGVHQDVARLHIFVDKPLGVEPTERTR